MDDRVARLDAAVTVLTDHVRHLEARVTALEAERAVVLDTGDARDSAAAIPGFDAAPVQGWLALVGRTLVVLGGAYLLRALTESHVLSAPVGVALGLLYGAPWLWLAARAGARGGQLDALCHALATALIGYPLVWEATLRFGVLGPAQSAALLGALTAAALVLAAVTRLHGLAWVVTFGAFGSAAGLALATADWNSYTLLAIALGLGTLWLGYLRGWNDLRWPAAAGANLMLLFAVDHAALTSAPAAAMFLLLLVFGGYVASFALRTLAVTRPVMVFDAAQSAAVLILALGGSVYLLAPAGRAFPVGIAAMTLGLPAYVFAFSFVRRRRDVTAFFFWALFALVLTASGIAICAGATIGSLAYAASAVALSLVARKQASLTLALHASLSAIAAAGASGLLSVAAAALLVSPAAGWPPLDSVALIALVALAATVVIPVHRGGASTAANDALASLHGRRVPRLALVFALLLASMGIAIWVLASAFGDPRRLDVSTLATLRTAVLVAATLALARAARYDGGREAGWLMYPLLVATGLKLVFVDVLHGRPQTLFAALALYGFALIVAPRLLRDVAAAAARKSFAPATHGTASR